MRITKNSVCWKFCVSSDITITESSKISQKCFVEITLLRRQIFEWDKALNEESQKAAPVRAVHPQLLTNMTSKKWRKLCSIIFTNEIAETLDISQMHRHHTRTERPKLFAKQNG